MSRELTEMIERIDTRFRSGNSVPVERAPVKRDEWEAIKAALQPEPPK